jgi:ectoine hydroxylase-related dioxygenase (phytanoyl-CoA dioxygenase family)
LDIESKVYNEIRNVPAILSLASHPRIKQVLKDLKGETAFGLLEKVILRIDLPNTKEEVAHWHQDYYYVKGNTDIVTLWMPLQDVNQENGCLLVQPGSHKLGAVAHSRQIGKRFVPTDDVVETFDPVEVEMQLGDILLFHALLFHSGQLNQTNRTRYSFQFRYTSLNKPTDAGMGRVISLG